jgi:uncharacterized cupredoxin-like copper-binding protein
VKPARTVLALTAALALLAAACGDDDTTTAGGGGDGAERTVEIDMVDTAFEPETLGVARGETVRFVFTNTGEIAHDAFIGDDAAQDDHEMEMRDADEDAHGGGHDDDDAEAITVEPGDSGELTYTFDEPGDLEIGCHQAGHYEAGMRVAVTVS